jgi:hypothetical protein
LLHKKYYGISIFSKFPIGYIFSGKEKFYYDEKLNQVPNSPENGKELTINNSYERDVNLNFLMFFTPKKEK